jgi:hypothetical protein
LLVLLFVGVWWSASAVGVASHVGADFRDFLNGTRTVAAGGNPYHRLLLQQNDNRSGHVALPSSGYIYPPLLALLLAPFVRSGLSDHALAALWLLLDAGALVWMGRELNLALRGRRGRRDWTWTLIFANLCLLPSIMMYDLFLGQSDILLAALATGAFGRWARGARGGPLLLAAAIAIKPTFALLLLVWLWKRDWKALLTCVGAAVLLVFGPFLLTGWQSLLDWLAFLTQFNAFSGSADFFNQAPTGLLIRLFAPNGFITPLVNAPWLVTPLHYAVALGALALWLLAVPARRQSDTALAMAECLLAFFLLVLVSPIAEFIHYCILTPALVGLAWLAWTRRMNQGGARWGVWGAYLLFCVPSLQDIVYPRRLFPFPGQSAPFFGALVVTARMGAFLWVALLGLLAGAHLLRHDLREQSSPHDATAEPIAVAAGRAQGGVQSS